MSLIALPLVIVNLGAEMVYILDQRLKAQCIAEDKSRMVLNDVVRTWFDDKLVAELFKPQQLYSLPATRQVFERIAHSSIMRLNQSRYAWQGVKASLETSAFQVIDITHMCFMQHGEAV